MSFLRTVLCSLVFLGFSAHGAAAQVETYHFDKLHTQIIFFVDHLGFAKSEGEFLDFDGSITFDRTQPESSSADVTIQTASIEMDDQKWNDHLKNADFFNVEKFPTMSFKSTSIEITGDNLAAITGDLTLLGVTKPVVLDVTFNKCDKHPFGNEYHCGFSAASVLNRSEWGMGYGLPMVGDEVEIRIEVEAVRDEPGNEGQGNP
ncbi:MAG: YceI family protein [Alphaproteobacteria bacterium]|nr:YceI family protein [Alphaproteobacteria bacterium]MCD8520147.1 YceI family protein [Alphaproteobacteria bacterium]MCD8571065.1 YceI family protein [Alphaproteobacteria bacterium]